MIQQKAKSIKLIELEDYVTDYRTEYPYVHAVSSTIRFRLRSKLVADYEPIVLIEKLYAVDYLFPLKEPIDISSQHCLDNFILLKGTSTKDGAWQTYLPEMPPGVISFQLIFVGETTITDRFGSADVILLTQDKFELRQLRKMTVFPRCIGKIHKWEEFFMRQHELGYNAFHLAPIQQTGASKSYYSLFSHLDLSEDLFTGTREEKYKQLETVLLCLKQKGIIFFVDIILNHASFDSEWVSDDPRTLFTCDNTPMLYTGFLVDEVIYYWGQYVKEMMAGGTEVPELTADILSEIENGLKLRINMLNIHEYFFLHKGMEAEMLYAVPTRKPSENIFAKDPIEAIEEFLIDHCLMPNQYRFGVRLKSITDWKYLDLLYEQNDLRLGIYSFNKNWYKTIKYQWIPEIISKTIWNLKNDYLINAYRTFDDPYPLVNRYFSRVVPKEGEVFYALNNGWVEEADNTEVFATSKKFHCLRRHVHAWGDLLRVRYGNNPIDSPVAWDYMTMYVKEMAKYFDGFRMDNLHGTQLNVARHMIKEARKVNPSLIVFAELFTKNKYEEAVFTRNIGINSTLKYAQHLLSGPRFTASFHSKIEKTKPYLGSISRFFEYNNEKIKYSLRKQPIALVYDLTHDNQTYIYKGLTRLQTPITVLLSLIGTFIGSTKGYDQFYNRKISVTYTEPLYDNDQESRAKPIVDISRIQTVMLVEYLPSVIFGSWDSWSTPHPFELDELSKKYTLRLELAPGAYEYKFKKDKYWFLSPSRYANSKGNHEFVLSEGYYAYKWVFSNIEELRRRGSELSNLYFSFKEYYLYHVNNIVVMIREPYTNLKSLCVIVNLSYKSELVSQPIKLPGRINKCEIWRQTDFYLYEGLTTLVEVVKTHNLLEFFDINYDPTSNGDVLSACWLPAGFACFIETSQSKEYVFAIYGITYLLERKIYLPPLGPLDVNLLLFGAAKEEYARFGQSNYVIPQDHNKQLVYAGFAGVYSMVVHAKKENNLSLGLFYNLRQGRWLLDYYLTRIKKHKHLAGLTEYLERIFRLMGELPRYLIPKHFCAFIYNFVTAVYKSLCVPETSALYRRLILASNQFISHFPNNNPYFQTLVSAGLPHFAVDWSRCWGRDTFTSNELMLLHPAIYKQCILQFASALRHGMIPNLLNAGVNPRYNCRDACWWFIRGVKEYISATKDTYLLKQKVNMLFLSNDQMEHKRLKADNQTRVMLLEDIIQEIFQSHANGIHYREWNAGYEIDSNMTSDGFVISMEIDPETGFIIGGNQYNCLTWMDKMGSSVSASNKGMPATPRAGAPIELVGLLYFCLTEFVYLYEEGFYSYNSVTFRNRKVKFSEWAYRILHNFEDRFFLAESSSSNIGKYVTGIYKDVANGILLNEEDRFRPNALIAMVVAPDLFSKYNARCYLKKVEQYLISLKSIGVSTLHEAHSLYAPTYDNEDNSNNPKLAHGFSYHNGPEWVWLYGFYISGKAIFDEKPNQNRLLALLQEHAKYIYKDEWMSLPYITNVHGQLNKYSCHAQAWSISSILLAIKTIREIGSK